MKNFVFTALLFACISCTSQTVKQNTSTFVFRGVNVIPMDKMEVLNNQDVVVSDGKVVSVQSSSSVDYDQNAVLIDAKGKYLIPGLAEMHAHVPPVDDIAPMKDVVRLFTLKGITTIRGMLGHPRHLELREKINTGEIIGPRFITSGPSINGSTANTAAKAEALVRDQKKAGYDFLKLHPGIKKENFAVIANTAKEVGIPFAGHVSYDVGVWRAIEAGYTTIDHLDGFIESLVPGISGIPEADAGIFGLFIANQADETLIGRLVDSLRANQIWVVPTQALAERWFHPGRSAQALAKEEEMKYMDPATLKNWINAKTSLQNNPKYNPAIVERLVELRRQLILACTRAGVGILLGSDAPQVFDVPGYSTHHELQYLVDAGLTPYEALKTGTVHVGQFLKRSDIGIIRQGAVSDLILLNGNPLEDIRQTWNIEGVMLGRVWMDKQYLSSELAKLEGKIR
jgi:imidazolonepropionase-like amidohydrolase